MNFNPYAASHKVWDHVGNITPNVEYCEPARPHGEFMAASWLPVQREDKYYEHQFVLSAGKIVALDRQGRVVPAGLKRFFADEAAGGGAVLTYSATDVTEGVISLATGITCTATSYIKSVLTTALIGRGLIDADENCDDFISHPVGVASYNFIKHPGGDGNNPADYLEHNYNMQHRVAILTKYVMEMPVVPAVESAVDVSGATAISDSAIADWTNADAQGAWFSSTSLSLTVRYAQDVTAGDDVVAWNLTHMDLAKDTTQTPFTKTGLVITAMSNEVFLISDLTATGDYMVDYDVGVILFYEADGDAAAVATGTLTYYTYESVPGSPRTYACAVGDLKPGDFLRTDVDSNFVKAEALDFDAGETFITNIADASGAGSGDATAAELTIFANNIVDRALEARHQIIGQVLEAELHPKDYLERVRTGFTQLTYLDQMPGSASAGLPTQLTYAGGANKVIRILLLK
jgi:hypothetical protein